MSVVGKDQQIYRELLTRFAPRCGCAPCDLAAPWLWGIRGRTRPRAGR